jgi:VWFA-related protein
LGRGALIVCLCLTGIALLATQTSLHGMQEGAISIDVKVINLLATVRDKKGKIVSSLGQDDFILQEDGRPQSIRYFSKETDLALSLGLLVDISGSQRGVLGEERSASHSFLEDLLRAGQDRAFLIEFDHEVELLKDLTSSREQLERALNRLGKNSSGPAGGRGGNQRGGRGGPGGGPLGGTGNNGTLLYDAVFLAADEVMRSQEGRKALIVLSDGIDHGSKVSIDTAIRTAQRADTVVYSILFTDNQQPQLPFGLGPNGKKILDRISGETGGRMFEVTKKQSIEDIYQTIAEELRNQYSIGYSPAATNAGPGYRKISLAAKRKDYVVQTRDGYYADR